MSSLSDFDFDLPEALIAQEPSESRGGSRLLVLDRESGAIEHSSFSHLQDHLRAGDLLVVNNTKVFPARLLGRRVPSGGAVECLLVRQIDEQTWEALMHPGQKLKPGSHVVFEGASEPLHGEVLGQHFHGRRTVRLWTDSGAGLADVIDTIGHIPLPPYIKRDDRPSDRERYQTIYARERGSIAAPTAGLHFTDDILAALAARGIDRIELTLHVGYGTFKPMRDEALEKHVVDPERFIVSDEAAAALTRARQETRRIIAVGTTTVRALESLTIGADGAVEASRSGAHVFIRPGHEFRLVNAMITNFHLPRSSLLVLVAAFAGRERVLDAYRDAVARGYRFYSYGDAMFIG
ncbi:MAG: tRNA preQ1(34) S-adenosylmethionine ribosyltransferase-isomerase QueA [Acidobacteria bacterium]|nr:tRNA preQ1(34) S-adenosylmethionine ribosyltransferase-isomerase QueA [Acidobacteriota bacterium]